MPGLTTVVEGIVGVVRIGINIVLSPLLRARRVRWGATDREIRQPMPGDELSPHPRFVETRAVTIHAPPDKVWPWLVQLGCKRAGWYSYDLLDNGGKPSLNRIVPEFQNLQVGDTIPMTPNGNIAMPVRDIDPGWGVVLGGTLNPRTGHEVDINDPNVKEYFSWIITYVVEPAGPNTSRLISRNRADWNRAGLNDLAYGLFLEAIAFVMERKMMLGIKARAEGHA